MNILVVGGTSAIAQAAARIWAARGDALYLAARRETMLAANAEDLRVRGARAVGHEVFDVLDSGGHAGLLDRATAFLGGLDVVLVAHGSLPDNAEVAADPQAALRHLEVNGTSASALILHAANRMEARGQGVIAVITSVAGLRGRASNYVYGSAKAQVIALLSGLRQRLASRGVAVVDIRPGFVDTPMTAAFPKGPLWSSAARCGEVVVAAVDARSPVRYAPWFWRWIMLVIRLIPEPIFTRLRL